MLVLIALIALLSPPHTSGVSPDSTGLVGTPYYYDRGGRYPAPKFWANPRDSALKPRRRDRNPHLLMLRMGSDFDPRWMRRTKREDKMMNISSSSLEPRAAEVDERRPSVGALWEAALALQAPATWPSPPPGQQHEWKAVSSEPPAAWLVTLGSCPAKHEWKDLGIYFWPRLVRRVECERPANVKPGATATNTVGCGWPPGRLNCGPGLTKTLQLLRWHCRLRNGVSEIFKRLSQGTKSGQKEVNRKPRKRYRCDWVKVPYPVPADCQCGGF